MNEIPYDVEQVLIGSLLGDGTVYIPDLNARFSEAHNLDQSDYLIWKAKILSRLFGGKIYEYPNLNRIEFVSRTSPLLTEIRKRWYPNGKKVVSEMDLKNLDALGLAVWYQDDGCYNPHGRHCIIAIDDFKGQEHVLKRLFNERWELDPIVEFKKGGYPRLRFSVAGSDKLLRIIRNHIHPSMIYKLGHVSEENLPRIEAIRKRDNNHKLKFYRTNREKILEKRREIRRLKRKTEIRECPECHEKFETVDWRRIYCSMKCYLNHARVYNCIYQRARRKAKSQFHQEKSLQKSISIV